MVNDDVTSDGIQNVDGLGSPHFPGASGEGVGLGGQRADGANVDDVAGELAGEHLLDVGADLQVVASTRRPQLFHARDFVAKSNATRALRSEEVKEQCMFNLKLN